MIRSLFVLSAFFLVACSTTPINYIDENSPNGRVTENAPRVYSVKKGDTLFAISWRYGISQQTIMMKNNIINPNKIYIGQKLRLNDSASAVGNHTTSSSIDDEYANAGNANSNVKHGQWIWPMKGKVIRYFKKGAVGANGLRIAGKPNQTVNAAEAGEVAYRGSGLKGLGNVVIIKHRTGLLSAYGFLSKIYVKKGQMVNKRQKIGTVGYSPDNKLLLHFEIRKNQVPINPISYIGTDYHF